MTIEKTKQTEAVLKGHLNSLSEGVEAVLSYYSEDCILFTPEGPRRGLAEIRDFFEEFMKEEVPKLMESFEIIRQDIDGEVAYITWKADNQPFGTDTFIVQNGKIHIQSFGYYTID